MIKCKANISVMNMWKLSIVVVWQILISDHTQLQLDMKDRIEENVHWIGSTLVGTLRRRTKTCDADVHVTAGSISSSVSPAVFLFAPNVPDWRKLD